MALVELDPLRDVLVGRPGQSGLSVEQRKRLTIAVELVSCGGHVWFSCWFTCCKPNLSRLRSRDCDSSQQLLLLGAHIVA